MSVLRGDMRLEGITRIIASIKINMTIIESTITTKKLISNNHNKHNTSTNHNNKNNDKSNKSTALEAPTRCQAVRHKRPAERSVPRAVSERGEAARHPQGWGLGPKP